MVLPPALLMITCLIIADIFFWGGGEGEARQMMSFPESILYWGPSS